jgi:hypothetical protein
MPRRLAIAWWCAVGAAGALATPAAAAAAQVRPVANLIIGDGVMVIKAGTGKHVYIGAAGSATRTVTLTLDAGSVDAFVADAQALVARGTRPVPAHTSDRPEIEEMGSTRALSVTRHVDRAHGAVTLNYHIFVSDDRLGGFALSASPVEMRSILLAFHRAAQAANALSAPPDTTHHAARRPASPGGVGKPATPPQRGPN